MIEHVPAEAVLRCNVEAHPGVVCLSSREDHGYGSWAIDRRFDPATIPVGSALVSESAPDFDSRATTITPGELIGELASPAEVAIVMTMLRDMCHMCVEALFQRGLEEPLSGALRLTGETVEAIRARWPDGSRS